MANAAPHVLQSSDVPGALLELHAALIEMDLPVEKRASVRVELRRADGTTNWMPARSRSTSRNCGKQSSTVG
jgi:hypothetical protein